MNALVARFSSCDDVEDSSDNRIGLVIVQHVKHAGLGGVGG